MKYNRIQYLFWSFALIACFTSCSNDDDVQAMMPEPMATCDDNIMNGDETGVDCGGSCIPCETMSMDPDFSGTFAQVDFMGRPGINTTLSFDMDGQPSVKDAHNVAIPSEMVLGFQAGFQARLEQYHDVYANKLGLDPNDVDYESNILGLDAATLTTVLAADVLEVAPNLPTTYFDPGTDNNNDGILLVPDGDEVALTGRKLTDDIIDVSLILFFGGAQGDRFSGQDLDMDGTSDLPRLTSDGVGFTGEVLSEFPYISNPE
ncbi:hypothetical protein [Flagellimonas allohymeniacidonis]|uniref:DUF4331 domain-containing protein n=1 Tax=Flagellimonas allohymeniacidonis TaxID=2517819 RepID=A0A4Q8QDN4_9FLAO|nr:hypothetical protein [Allomuricauda hymeniacidonis]TAI48515.1 hypothetical protein EW142_01540 [Allomuricauda hymeniacidonis]